MSKSSKQPSSTADWDKMWQEYTSALDQWKLIFDSFQKACVDMQQKYNNVMEKAATESSKDTMKEFGENWQKAMNEYTGNAFKQFGENWQNTMSESAMESFKAYGDMMNKFAETWKKMWRT